MRIDEEGIVEGVTGGITWTQPNEIYSMCHYEIDCTLILLPFRVLAYSELDANLIFFKFVYGDIGP